MKVLSRIIAILLGLVLIASAVAKAMDIESFEGEVYKYIQNYNFASRIAIIVIAIEVFLGLCIVMGVFLRHKFILLVTAVMLVTFSIYLVFKVFEGDQGDCFCFGNWLAFSPMASLVKNVILFVMTLFCFFFTKPNSFSTKDNTVIIIAIFILTGATYGTLLLNKQHGLVVLPKSEQRPILAYELMTAIEFHEFENHKRFVLAFYSATCSHCEKAGSQMAAFGKLHPDLKYLSFINGSPEDAYKFVNTTGLPNNYRYLLNGMEFAKRSGNRLPAIYLIEHDSVKAFVKHLGIHELEIMEDWCKE